MDGRVSAAIRVVNAPIEPIRAHLAAAGPYSGTFWPLPMTAMPYSVTMNPRARSSSWSTPIRRPRGTWTFLSMIARWTTAPAPDLDAVEQHAVGDRRVRCATWHAGGEDRAVDRGAR